MMRWLIVINMVTHKAFLSIYWSFQEKLQLGYFQEDQSKTNMQISV